MTQKKLLLGSLSNDLYRVASMIGRGSSAGASRFLIEAKKWSLQLTTQDTPKYIQNIIHDVNSIKESATISQEVAEKLLMYSVLLQNFTRHFEESV